MADYSDHVKFLILVFTTLVALFLIASMFRWEDFWRPLVFSIALTMLVILILARFGGDLGRTV